MTAVSDLEPLYLCPSRSNGMRSILSALVLVTSISKGLTSLKGMSMNWSLFPSRYTSTLRVRSEDSELLSCPALKVSLRNRFSSRSSASTPSLSLKYATIFFLLVVSMF
mgnify:CR=1 FL=1